MAATNQPPNVTRKSVSGFITKLVGDGGTFGFINDEIFFQQDVVVGGPAALNDRIFAECEYSENLPIKWNATSIKIIQRANASPGGPSTTGGAGGPAAIDSDPRKRQGLLNQSQVSPVQPPFNQAPNQPVANTYQQHRQQRQQQQQQQQQILRPQPFETPNQADNSSINPLQLLDQSNLAAPEFYLRQPFCQAPNVPQAHDIPPFQMQIDTPMGPPKITYTSQLGTAFVQNQPPIIPSPFMNQTPPATPSMLPNQQQQGNQRMKQQQQQQQGRFLNQNNKAPEINRQLDNRNRNRGDGNRSDHLSRTQDRDLKTSNNDNRNQSSRADNSSRDRSTGRNSSPRRDRSSRASPLSHRSRTSVSSERSGSHSNSKNSKLIYEAHNIPKSQILTNLNGWNMKSRLPSSIHVPSDLKEIIVNKYFRLDIKNTPKPIRYNVETTKISENNDVTNTEKQEQENNDQIVTETKGEEKEIKTESDEFKRENTESSSLITPPTSQPRPDIRLNHKYGVKVVLISLPELEQIYKDVFGADLDSYNSESTRPRPRLDESISILCNRGPNGGHSLIGGKFDPILDGFVEGERNEFERHGRQPDLIATCRRAVLEQTGLDLGPCKSWTLLATFLYNNKSDYFSPKAAIEYSYIYMPQIWTMAPVDDVSKLKDSKVQAESVKMESEPDNSEQVTEPDNSESVIEPDHSESMAEPDHSKSMAEPDKSGVEIEQPPQQEQKTDESSEQPTSEEGRTSQDAPELREVEEPTSSFSIESLADLKVADLKVQLDSRDIKYKPNAKKAELVALLHGALKAPAKAEDLVPEESATAGESGQVEATPEIKDETKANDSQILDEDKRVATSTLDKDPIDNKEPLKAEEIPEEHESNQTNKRKTPDSEATANDDGSNEVKSAGEGSQVVDSQESQIMENQKKKKQKVELIKDTFVVKSKEGQQQQLIIVQLYDVIQVSRYDQFELSVTSNLLKESLVQHLSEYIFTTLVEDYKSRNDSTTNSNSISSAASISSGSSSQETNNSDSNNNTNCKTPKSQMTGKEYPVDRYINLAFAHFDSNHMGYLHADDLSKLFNNTSLTVSKRALISLIGESDKFNYRTLADLSPKLAPTHMYKFPEQFQRLPGASYVDSDQSHSSSTKMIEYQGVMYEISSLIEQVRELETVRVNMIERFNYAIENFDKQSDEIHVLEVNQKSLTDAIEAQNNEISELKRERDSIKRKLDQLRKGIKNSISSLSEMVSNSKDQDRA